MARVDGCGDGAHRRLRFAECLGPAVLLCVIFASLLGVPARADSHSALPAYAIEQFGYPPPIPNGPLPQDRFAAVERLLAHSLNPSDDAGVEAAILRDTLATADPRVAWLIVDIMRFTWRQDYYVALAEVARALLATEFQSISVRDEISNRLIAWRVPAYPGYLEHKRAVFTRYVRGLDVLFKPGDIAWERVSWGGVNIDSRPYGKTDTPCDCIPAADDPAVTSAAEATWLKDEDIVFGLAVNGEYRAYPRRILEVREMVNDTLGGRQLGIPYCSLCGAAQAYFTDRLPDAIARPVLRTSGLLIRSNKVMYDLNTHSLFDTFRGLAVTGPLAKAGVALTPVAVVTARWGDWKAAHPETTVLVESLALGRDYKLRETRDARGPVFPVGDVDPRLPVHEDIVGVVTSNGTAVAFPRVTALLALEAGEAVELRGVRLRLAAGGLRARDEGGRDLASHPAYWFAWSQFHPETLLWAP